MTKLEVLELLRSLLHDSFTSYTDPEDWSGCNTEYLVDHEQLSRNIEKEIENLKGAEDASDLEDSAEE